MDDEQRETSFGRYLRTFREQRGMRIQELSELTKIPIHVLRNLEGESLHRLPEPVYVKGFIRSYARAVGADPTEAVGLYLKKAPTIDRPGDFCVERPEIRKRFWPGLLLSLVGFIGIVFFSVWGMSVIKKRSEPTREPVIEAAVAVQEDKGTDGEPRQKPVATDPSEAVQPMLSEGYLLDLKAIMDTWVRVTIDDHDPKEYLLKTGDQLALKATSGFLLHIGNSAGITMKLNGAPFLFEGKRGQPVKLKLP